MKTTAAVATAEKVLLEDTPPVAHIVCDNGLPPPTHAHVEYWRDLCGALSLKKGHGMANDAWPVDLRPSRPTLKALVERGLIVRRKRAWHLKRGWYSRLTALRQRAVPTPRQSFLERPRADLPSYAELEGCERICRWLDAQPKRRARLPFVGLVEQLGADQADQAEGVGAAGVESELPTALLLLMRKHRLARHTSTCEWVLSPTWKQRLLALWRGVNREVRERFPAPPSPAAPFVVAAGIDTWYLNRIDPAGLPLSLRHALDELQAKASEDEEEVDTSWLFDGALLRMYRAGVSTKQGGGVSWSYILRNNALALLIRRAPLGGIVAQARLSSECLWRLAPRRALDELDALVRRMWIRPLPFRRKEQQTDTARWQVSQVHLAVDVANVPLEVEQLARYVSRSRSRATFEAAKSEVEKLLHALRVDGNDDPEPLVLDWDALYEDDAYDAFDAVGFEDRDKDTEPEPVEDRKVIVHQFGTRHSGVTFSPGGNLSMVLYDKVLQSRLSGKRHMEPIWAAAGWQTSMAVTRHEARLRRPALRELGLPNELRACLNDPWEFLTHVKDVFGAVVGRSEPCPDAVDVAWIRRVVPEETDTHRSRWPTDPTWRVVQAATFAEAPAEARRLIRRRQQGNDVKVLDRGQYGYLVSRVAIRHPSGGEWTLSRALGEALPALDALEAEKGKDFGELVRERRRQRGLPLPLAEKVLPFRTNAASQGARGDEQPAELISSHRGEPSGDSLPPRAALAETRVAEAWACLAAAEREGATRRALDRLEVAYLTELATYHAAIAHLPSSAGDRT
jgi:hypothetical protein